MKKYSILLFLVFSCFVLKAQSEKEIKTLGIKTKNVWVNLNEKSKYLESTEKYDSNGNVLEEIKYEKDKSIKKHVIWTYNSNNDKLTETHLDASGNTIKKIVYEYNGSLRIMKKEYNEKNKLVSWKTYTYEMTGK
jgi:hypothetical protein